MFILKIAFPDLENNMIEIFDLTCDWYAGR